MSPGLDSQRAHALLERAKGGDSAALGDLMELFREQLLAAADSGLAPAAQAKAAASDIVQETFLEAQRLFARFRGEHAEQFRAWLRAILDFKLKEHHNRFFNSQKRQLDRERSLDHGPLRDELPGDAKTPSSVAARNEDLAELTAAMDRLPEKYRQVIVWHHWEKLTFVEIGRRLGRSEDAARMLFGRAIARLAREME